MFAELKAILQVVVSVIDIKKKKDREEKVIELFEMYYLFNDILQDAKIVLMKVNDNPLLYIKNLDKESVPKQLEEWDIFLRNQSIRLYSLQEYFSDNSFLTLVNPKAVNSIKSIIGYKMDTVKTLHGLGAGLFFRNIFPSNKERDSEEVALLVIETLTFNDNFCLKRIKNELISFEDELEKFSSIIKDLVEKNELLELSAKARENSSLC